MAWQTVATTGLSDSSGTYGYVYLQYDDSSTGTSRSSRLRFELKSGCSVYVYINSLSLDGSSVKSQFLCNGTMNFWTGSLAYGTRSFTWSCPWYSGTRSYTCSGYIPSGIVAPSTPSVSIASKTYNSATFNVSISSYGVPSSTSGRYIEAAILAQNSYGNSYRYSTKSNTTSSSITVNNSSSTGSTALTIEGNHKYWYGGYASNTQAHSSTVTGSFYTPCPPLASLSLSSQTYSAYNKVNAVLSYTRQADGGAETRTGYYRYSTDGGSTYSSWISFGTISVATGTAATFTAALPTSSSIIIQAKISTPNGGDSALVSTSFNTSTTHTAPNFSNFEYVDNNSAAIALTGNNQTMIQGQSIPLVTVSTANKATGNNGVAVSNYAITFVGQSKTVAYSSSESVSASLSAPSESGTANLVVSAVDSLSLSTAVAKSIVVYPWSAPSVSASIGRINNFESQSTLKISGTYAPILIDNEAKNSLSVAYRTKMSSSSDWGEWNERTVTISDGSWSTSDLSISLDNNYQWDIQVKAADAFVDTIVNLILSIGMPSLFVGCDGRIAIGMKPNVSLPTGNKGQLEVDGNIYAKNLTAASSIYANGKEVVMSHVGQIIRTTKLTTASSVAAIYGGTWTRVNDYHLVAYAVLSAKTTIAVAKNISSVTESSTGTYKVTLSKAMSNANYVAIVSGEVGGAGCEIIGIYGKTTTTFSYDFTNYSGTLVEPSQVHITVFGEFATPDEYYWKRTA